MERFVTYFSYLLLFLFFVFNYNESVAGMDLDRGFTFSVPDMGGL